MGIPNFKRWLLEKYRDIKQINAEIQCDNLYLDMNGIIHKCAQQDLDEQLIIQHVFDFLDRLIRSVRPRKLVYIALDGVVPRIRMTHQRNNRFVRSKDLSQDKFDKCHIKPGTQFMMKFYKCLHYFICHRMNTDQLWHSLKIILSNANMPGEGEQKIINFIRKQSNLLTRVIYGSDSDLILLGLSTHQSNLIIIHEFNDSENKFICISLSKLRIELIHESKKISSLWDVERFIDDWIFLCLLFGNDYLPKSFSIDFFGHSITMEILLNVYKRTLPQSNGYLTENGTINQNRLILFFKALYESDKDGKLRRTIYYKDKFHIQNNQLENFVSNLVEDYVRGLSWTLAYYFGTVPSWNWYYPHYYAPLIYDFRFYLKIVTLNFQGDTQAIKPFQQMLATFSPVNVDFLPLSWRSLMTSEKSPIIEYYPKKFDIDPNGQRNNSQSVALLPFVDLERILLASQLADFTLTNEEMKRNQIDLEYQFIHSTNNWDNMSNKIIIDLYDDEKVLLSKLNIELNDQVFCFVY